MPVDTRRLHHAAAAFIASGCALGALLGWAWDAIRSRSGGRP